jgi:hypothetical protein
MRDEPAGAVAVAEHRGDGEAVELRLVMPLQVQRSFQDVEFDRQQGPWSSPHARRHGKIPSHCQPIPHGGARRPCPSAQVVPLPARPTTTAMVARREGFEPQPPDP